MAVSLAGHAAAQNSIGINFVNSGNGGVQNGNIDSLLPEELAGVIGYAQTNWNNFGRWGQTVAANDSSGAASGITVTWDSNNTWQNGADTGTPDGKLMYGYLDATGAGGGNNEYSTAPGAYHFFWNENKPEAYVTGISTWLAAQGATKYAVVVYLDGDTTGGRVCETWLASGLAEDPPTTLGSDLAAHVFTRDSANFSGTYTPVPLSANSVANAADGNYVVFTDVTADSFILRTEERGFHAAFISGFQIIPTTNAIPPTIFPQPKSSGVYSGQAARFVAGASGTTPLSYQWRHYGTNISNGGHIAGATTDTLLVSSVAAADGGDYTLVVTNAGGAITSSVASLSIVTAPTVGGYAHSIFTNGAVTHWRLNETGDPATGGLRAFDYIGGYVGTYGSNSVVGATGPEPTTFPGLESGNTAVGIVPDPVNPTYVTVAMPALNTNTVTITAWINPAGVQADGTGILMTRGDTTAGLIFNSDDNQLGYSWNNDAATTWSWDSGLRPPLGEWSFVALVIEPTKATIYLGSSGVLTNMANTIAHVNEVWGGAAWIGRDSANAARVFNGSIDEVSVFKRSLSFDEIAGLYGLATGVPQTAPPSITAQPASRTRYAGQTAQFVAAASGTAPLVYQWRRNNVNLSNGGGISGATTDTLTVANLTGANAGDYTLVVTNGFNSVTSEVATLTVVTPTAAYESQIIALNPVAYWRLNEANDPTPGTEPANDFWGGFAGTYASAVQNGFNSIAGPLAADGFGTFGSANNAVQCANNVGNAYVATPALGFSGNTVTLTAWVYPTAPQVSWSGIVFSRGGSPATGLNISGGGNLGYHWRDSFWNVESGLVLPSDQWSFVALVVQPDRGTLYLFNNAGGLQSYTNAFAHTTHTFSSGFRIGGDAQGDDRTFNGKVDEVAVFNTALTPQQIAGLLPVKLTLQPSGADLILSWPFGTLLEADNVTGPWTTNVATSPLTVTPNAGRKFYRVQVQ